MAVLFFWLSLFLIVYVYFLYPLTIVILSLFMKREITKKPIFPFVSIIISAYNEEKHIKETIENKLNLEYPKNKFEIIVVSDGSIDKTDEIVQQLNGSNILFIRQEPRQGKTAALNMAVTKAKGDIIVFSDANSIYSENALKELVANFSDNSVGYVTGKMVYVNPDGSIIGDGCSVYMKYENYLRKIETAIGSVVGVDGGIDAIRKELFSPMRPDQLPDFVLPLKVIDKGHRVIYESAALLNEQALNRSNDEYKMRVRVSLRALNAIRDMRHLLNPFKYGLFAWQFMSHKLLRYCVFILIIGLYVFNLLIIQPNKLYFGIFLLQNIFYASALAGHYIDKKCKSPAIFYIPFYFCLINLASAHAFWKLLNNQKQVMWAPRRG
jgi:cellulose synthase/poly-beta-1,6-N-acetylglucosamine synthase-like glycosyltransferase